MGKIYRDMDGKKIKNGNILSNPYDTYDYIVLSDENGDLFLGSYDCPLENYRPQDFWKIIDKISPKGLEPNKELNQQLNENDG